MKRLALVLAAAVFGTGCIFVDDDECDRTVTLDWSFRNADGGVTASCGDADVQVLDVWVNGVFWGSFDCLGPPGTVALVRGANLVIVEGIDSLGRIAYRDTFSVDASACGSQGTIATQPAEGWLAVDYSFSPVDACFSPGPTFIWLKVHDDVAGQTAFVETGVTAFQECSVILAAPRYRLPVGSFTLLGVEEVSLSLGTVGADCTDRPFDIGAALTTTVQPVLVDSAIACF